MPVEHYRPLEVAELLEVEFEVDNERPETSTIRLIVRSTSDETIGVELPYSTIQHLKGALDAASAQLPGGMLRQ